MNSIQVLALSASGLGLILSALALTTTIIREKYEGLSASTATIVFWAGIGMLNSFSVSLIILGVQLKAG